MRHIARLFRVIDNSLFMVTGSLEYDRITDAIIALTNAVHGFEGGDWDTDQLWAIGEHGCCSLPDFIVGAYWHYTEWHAGQSSQSYAALSALGTVFSPGMTCGESDNAAYIALNELAEQEQAS